MFDWDTFFDAFVNPETSLSDDEIIFSNEDTSFHSIYNYIVFYL